MAAKAISIEIGYSLTKVCEVDYKAKTHKVYRFFTIPTAEGIINDGILHVTPEYVAELNAEITKRKIRTKQVVFSITSGRIASREVTIPFVKENRITDVVNANASDYFPVDLSQYQLAYSILGTIGDPKGAQQYKLLVMAAPSALLSGYYDLARALKLEVAAIDYAGNSVFQVAKDKNAQGTSLVIKIDEHSSLVMAVRDGRLAFVRNVSYGVEEAIQTIIESKRWAEADTVQSAMEVMSMNDCVTSPEMVEVTGQLTTGISRVVDYYISHNSDAAVGNVYITGLGANIRGLEEVLAKELNLHVEVLRQVQGWNLEKSFRTQYYGEFVACVGAAAAPLGFKKDAEKSKGKEKAGGSKGGSNLAPIAYTVFGLGLIIAVVLAAVSILRYIGLQKTNMQLKAQNAELEEIIPIYNEYTATLASFNLVKTMYGQTENRNEELVEFLEELEDKMPSDVHVVSFTSTVEGVAINMNVSSKSEAAAAIEQLRSFNSLFPASVTVNSVVEEIDEDSGTISVNFSVAAIYRDIHASDPEGADDAGNVADTDDAGNVADTDDTVADTDAVDGTEE